MLGVGVVGFVHGQCHRVVVDGDIHGPANGLLDTGAGTTAAGEVVHDQFIEVEAGLGVGAEVVHLEAHALVGLLIECSVKVMIEIAFIQIMRKICGIG